VKNTLCEFLRSLDCFFFLWICLSGQLKSQEQLLIASRTYSDIKEKTVNDSMLQVYNDANLLTSKTNYKLNESGSKWIITSRYKYFYSNGLLVVLEMETYYEHKDLIQKTRKVEYTYNEKDEIKDQAFYFWDGTKWVLTGTEVYTYTDNGDHLSNYHYEYRGTISVNDSRMESVYDSNNNLLRKTTKSLVKNEWKLRKDETYEYDERGNQTKYTKKDGSLKYVKTMTYDENDLQLSYAMREKGGWDGVWSETGTFTNENGKRVEAMTKKIEKGVPIHYQNLYEYDVAGLISKRTIFIKTDDEWQLHSEEYWHYDEAGNLIERGINENDKSKWKRYYWETRPRD